MMVSGTSQSGWTWRGSIPESVREETNCVSTGRCAGEDAVGLDRPQGSVHGRRQKGRPPFVDRSLVGGNKMRKSLECPEYRQDVLSFCYSLPALELATQCSTLYLAYCQLAASLSDMSHVANARTKLPISSSRSQKQRAQSSFANLF